MGSSGVPEDRRRSLRDGIDVRRGALVALNGIGLYLVAVLVSAYYWPLDSGGSSVALGTAVVEYWWQWRGAAGVDLVEGCAYLGLVLVVVGPGWYWIGRPVLRTVAGDDEPPSVKRGPGQDLGEAVDLDAFHAEFTVADPIDIDRGGPGDDWPHGDALGPDDTGDSVPTRHRLHRHVRRMARTLNRTVTSAGNRTTAAVRRVSSRLLGRERARRGMDGRVHLFRQSVRMAARNLNTAVSEPLDRQNIDTDRVLLHWETFWRELHTRGALFGEVLRRRTGRDPGEK